MRFLLQVYTSGEADPAVDTSAKRDIPQPANAGGAGINTMPGSLTAADAGPAQQVLFALVFHLGPEARALVSVLLPFATSLLADPDPSVCMDNLKLVSALMTHVPDCFRFFPALLPPTARELIYLAVQGGNKEIRALAGRLCEAAGITIG